MSMQVDIDSDIDMTAGIFLVSSGAEIRPLFQWDLGDFFPNLKKKIYIFLEFSSGSIVVRFNIDRKLTLIESLLDVKWFKCLDFR